MASHYVGVNIKPAEACVKRAVQECRKRVRLKVNQVTTAGWRIAKKDLEGNPSITDKAWAADMWLPRAFARGFQLVEPAEDCQHTWGHDEVCTGCGGHRYHVVLSHYADVDSSVTVKLWRRLSSELHSRGLWDIYQQRRKLLPIAHAMERRGVTVNGGRISEMKDLYQEEADRAERLCMGIATILGKELTLPKGGNNKSLTDFCFGEGGLNLPVLERTDNGAPSLNKNVMESYQVVLEKDTKPHLFITALNRKRKRDTAVSYLRAYEQFMLPLLGSFYAGNEVVEQREQEGAKTPETQKPVLGVDGRQVHQRLRHVQGPGGDQGTQGGVQAVGRGDTATHTGAAQVRQPALRKPETSVPGHRPGQHDGHDKEGSGQKSQRGGSPGGQGHGTGGAGDQVHVLGKSTGHTGGGLPEVRVKQSSGVWHSEEKILEARVLTGWFVMHPNLNPTGTDTLRWSSSMPNEQNISKRGIEVRCNLCHGDGCVACNETGWVSRNLRHAFGPAPGREWWSCDAKNIELRIPAYESGEQELIDLFERPDEAPYYGSTHLLNFHTVYPDIWDGELGKRCDVRGCSCNGEVVTLERVGPHCKKKFADNWYQYCKNGGFAVQYGSMDRADGLGTADRAFHRPGSHAKLKSRFAKLEAHNQRCIRHAERYGYVETIPDRSVDPARGYPLLCTRTERGKILPTVPLNYRTQGSACWWMQQAMIRCHARLCGWNTRGFDGHIALQVHDELVFDFPQGGDPRKDLEKESSGKAYFRTSNLWRVRELQKLMEQGGRDIGVPTPTSCEYHVESWAEGVTC
jgi:hypothetical protein